MDEILHLANWIEEKTNSEWSFYIKRLSMNDSGQTGAHQAGLYIPNQVMMNVFPTIQVRNEVNPRQLFEARVESHNGPTQELSAIYYNNKFTNGGTRDENRITSWRSGFKETPLANPENTGAITILAFHQTSPEENCDYLAAWVCSSISEEEYVEQNFGEVVPGETFYSRGNNSSLNLLRPERTQKSFPEKWLTEFPTGREIVSHIFDKYSLSSKSPCRKLVEARKLEFEVFKEIEEAHFLGTVKKGFESIDAFVSIANSILNRRKSRSGKSLEYHLEEIFKDNGIHFSAQCKTEGKKTPDFIFPSKEAYADPRFPIEHLNMLGVKTTCKDRWRQVLNEANRLKGRTIYLFTLQEGISLSQFRAMRAEKVKLVIPSVLVKKYPKELHKDLITLAEFLSLMKKDQKKYK